jgi:glycosyltransferase involved in cell wall biosynthesis
MRNCARISIVTPSCNQGKYIEKTIQSVLSQDVEGLEYMVCDGGSSDETLSVLERYGDRVPWISERDKGPSDAINKGFYCSSGDVLGWLNSDDIYYPGALQTALDFFEKNPDVDVMYGDANHIDENDGFIEKYPTEDWDWERLTGRCFISQPAAFFRRRVFEKYGHLSVGIRCMDYEYWLRLGKNGARFMHLPQLLAATRLYNEAFSVAGRVACHTEINSFTRKHLSRTPDQWLFSFGHAIAVSRGYNRRQPVRFISTLIYYSLYAALHWNHHVSKGMIRVFSEWIRENLLLAIRRV